MIPADLAATRGLQKYIQDNVQEFNKVIDEFPDAGCEMELPTCSITTVGTPNYTNLMPTQIRKEQDEDEDGNDLVYTMIGQFDTRLQVDIWSEYKIQRSRLLESVIDALNVDFFE